MWDIISIYFNISNIKFVRGFFTQRIWGGSFNGNNWRALQREAGGGGST